MNTNDTKYNGWTNYETWLVNLWLTNEQGTDEMLREWAQECVTDAIEKGCDANGIRNDAAYEMGQRIKDYLEENAPETQGVYADLINAALGSVNWYEIAEHFTDDIDVFSAGWNMPGYLSDGDPALFTDADDALEYIKNEAKSHCDSIEDGLSEGIEEQVNKWAGDSLGEFGHTFGLYHYFVAKL